MNRRDWEVMSRLGRSRERGAAGPIAQTLARQVRAFASAVADGETSANRFLPVWADEMDQTKNPLAVKYAADAAEVARELMTSKASVLFGGKRVGIAFQEDPDRRLLTERLVAQRVGVWVAETSKIETATTAAELENIIHRAAVAGEITTPGQVAQIVQTRGLAHSMVRANMLARTLTTWAHNEGAQATYEDAGVGAKEWLTTMDEMTCEYCEPMDGRMVQTDGSYFGKGETIEGRDGGRLSAELVIDHPPLHPNCRCALIPVLE